MTEGIADQEPARRPGALCAPKFAVARRCGLWHHAPIADVAKSVDAADFNWSARGEIRGVEPLKVGER